MDTLTFEVEASAPNPAGLYGDWLYDLFVSEQLPLEPPLSLRGIGWLRALHNCARAELYPDFQLKPMKPESREFNKGYAEARNWYEENSDRFQVKIRNRHLMKG